MAGTKKAPAKSLRVSKTRKPRTDVEVAKLKAAVKKLNAVSYDKVTLRMGNSQDLFRTPITCITLPMV